MTFIKIEDEWDTKNQDDITCPYCGYVHEDSWDFDIDHNECEIDCSYCGKEFYVYMETTVKYDTLKKEPKK